MSLGTNNSQKPPGKWDKVKQLFKWIAQLPQQIPIFIANLKLIKQLTQMITSIIPIFTSFINQLVNAVSNIIINYYDKRTEVAAASAKSHIAIKKSQLSIHVVKIRKAVSSMNEVSKTLDKVICEYNKALELISEIDDPGLKEELTIILKKKFQKIIDDFDSEELN